MNHTDKGLGRFIRRCLIGGVPLIIFFGAIIYFSIFVRPYINGDLGRLGNIAFPPEYFKSTHRSPFSENMAEKVCFADTARTILVVGDSFAAEEEIGFVNALAHQLNSPVAYYDFKYTEKFPLQQLSDMINSGYFSSHPEVKLVVLECVERLAAVKFKVVDSEQCLEAEEITRSSRPSVSNSIPVSDDSGWHLQQILGQGVDWIKQTLIPSLSGTRKATLSRPLFSCDGKERELYFYSGDISHYDVNPESVERGIEILQLVDKRLKELGVSLIFMVAPDKYEVYQDYIEGDDFQRLHTGERLRELRVLPFYMTSVETSLKTSVAKGEKDIYLCNDSHWSAKGSMIVAKLLADRINNAFPGVMRQD